MAQNRIFYAVYAVGFAKEGNTSYTTAHGVQSIGISTRFNLESVFEVGQIEEYASIEDVPDIEMTAEKVIDGYPLLYHLATNGATEGSLAGRSSKKCQVAVSYHTDTQTAASGTPLKELVASGMFTSSLTYTLPVQGNITESITLVGNDLNHLTANFPFAPAFNNTDTPPSGIQRRQHVLFGSGAGKSVLPYELPGMTNFGGSGFNLTETDGSFTSRVQNIRISTNLGRTPLYQLGRRTPYFRTVDFPVEVRTDIEMYCQTGAGINANSESTNVNNQPIWVRLGGTGGAETVFDLGNKNKLLSWNETGGNAQQGGGNRSITFSYRNFSKLTVISAADPSGL